MAQTDSFGDLLGGFGMAQPATGPAAQPEADPQASILDNGMSVSVFTGMRIFLAFSTFIMFILEHQYWTCIALGLSIL